MRICKQTIGTVTNDLGMYTLLLSPGKYRIAFSSIGFEAETLSVNLAGNRFELNVFLTPRPILLPAVTVYAGKRNPAELVILRVIARKDSLRRALKNYIARVYTKTVIRTYLKVHGKPDTIIAGIMETQSRIYWSRDTYREIILAREQTANIASYFNVITIGKLPDFSEDRISIEKVSFVSPIARDALNHYFFEMQDTTRFQGRPVFVLSVKPRTSGPPRFKGTLLIDTLSYAIVSLNLENTGVLSSPILNHLRIRQQNALYNNRYWLPIQVTKIYSGQYMGLKFQMEMTALLHEYRINQPVPPDFRFASSISVAPDADRRNPRNWIFGQQLALTPEEEQAYAKLDSLMSRANPITRIINFAFQWNGKIGPFRVLSASDFFHFSRVEGFYIGAGLQYGSKDKGVALRLRPGYAFSLKSPLAHFSARIWLDHKRRFSSELNIFRRVDYQNTLVPFSRLENSLSCLLYKEDYPDYFLRKGWSFWIYVRPSRVSSIGVGLTQERHTSLATATRFSLFYRNKNYRSNPAVTEGRFLYGSLELRMDNRQWVEMGRSRALLNERSYGFLNLRYDFSLSGRRPSYGRRLWLDGRSWQLLGNDHLLQNRFYLGYSFTGDLVQTRMDLPGAFQSFAPFGSFHSLSVRTYLARFLFAWIADYTIRNRLGPIPFPRLLFGRPDLTLHVGLAYLKDIVEWTKSGAYAPKGEIMIREIGFGIGNVLPMFRIFFTWRLDQKKPAFCLNFSSISM